MNRAGYKTNPLRMDVRTETGKWTKKTGSARAPPEKMSVESNETSGKYAKVDLSKDGTVYTYEFLTSLPDIQVTVLPDVNEVRGENGRVDTAKVVQDGMKNARSVGTQRDGKVFVENAYTGRQLRIDAASIRHGLNGNMNRLLTNARLGATVGTIVKNAVPINGTAK